MSTARSGSIARFGDQGFKARDRCTVWWCDPSSRKPLFESATLTGTGRHLAFYLLDASATRSKTCLSLITMKGFDVLKAFQQL
jgi:hypothetical protein